MKTVLLKPLINEKSMNLIKEHLFSFEVDKKATKQQIARVVKEKFSVDPLSVKTINIKGKVKMQRNRRSYYQTSGIKKALIRLKKGQKIALFETATEEPKETVTVTTAEGEPIEIKEKKSMFGKTKVKTERRKKE